MSTPLTKRKIVGSLPSDAKASVLAVVQAGQITRLSPIMWTTLELRRKGVSSNFHVLTDVARQIWTTAYYYSIEIDQHDSVFARYNAEKQEWEPDGTMQLSDEGLFYNKLLCADMIRQLKQLGFLDILQREHVTYDYQLPLSLAPGNVRYRYIFEQKFDAMQKLVTNSPHVIPAFLKPYRIRKEKYRRIVQYVNQCRFIQKHWEILLDKSDWQYWAYVSDEYQEHGHELSIDFLQRVGLL